MRDDLMVEGALFNSGRPVLVVPYIQRTGLKLDRVMACWDGSRNAARAINDAMPFLAAPRRSMWSLSVREKDKTGKYKASISRNTSRATD